MKKKTVYILIILILTFAAYSRVIRWQYIWDDQDYVIENACLRDASGLKRIWFDIGATPQYYPLVHTFFWIEYHIWGLHPAGYHFINVFLHALNAALLFLLLQRLKIPAAWLVAAVFALHPVHVESVAWITERKNVLSLFFYLLSFTFFIRAIGLVETSSESGTDANKNRPLNKKLYALAFVFYFCALLSKTIACSLPAAALLVIYWKKGRLTKKEIMAAIPFFITGIGFGLLTAGMERYRVGAVGRFWDLSFWERCMIAGRAIWFYAGKLVFPYPLMFVYPRWKIEQSNTILFLYPGGVILAVLVLWFLRNRIGRAPLVAFLFFAGTLFPALGFFNVYPMCYSFVADHFQYHASIGLITLFCALFAIALSKFPGKSGLLRIPGTAILLGVLGILTWRQTFIYKDYVTLFKETIKKNRDSSLVLTSVAAILSEEGDKDGAIKLYERAIELDDLDDLAHFNVGKIFLERNEVDRGVQHLEKSLNLTPDCAHYHYFLALGYGLQNREEEAAVHFKKAVELDPKEPFQRFNYGVNLFRAGKLDEAVHELKEAIRVKPDLLGARILLVDSLMEREEKRIQEAEEALAEGLRLHPDHPELKVRMDAVRRIKAEMQP
ncbi:tetratricopeptide repeat protein [Candidatus Sumerlaeota bacterium]|nr:tetratricopeptide repeat protein [Candidatus Sumerlaeota bacterium]